MTWARIQGLDKSGRQHPSRVLPISSVASFENDKPEVTVLLSGIRFDFGLWLVENIFHFVLLLKNAFLFLICFV